MSEQMIPVSQYLIQSCIEELESALESQVDRHCGNYICDYICDGYGNMSPEERWKKWGHSSTYETWEKLNKLIKDNE